MANPQEKQLPALISALLKTSAYDHPIEKIELIETHISWVLLTGHYAYKIKKPLKLGFLDFSTLEQRRFFCHEELRLNARWAKSLYLEVVAITGNPEQATMAGSGKAIEYAVKMLQFPQEAQLDHVLLSGNLSDSKIDAIASMVSRFHRRAEIAGTNDSYGAPQQVLVAITEVFRQLKVLITEKQQRQMLSRLEQWSLASFEQLSPLLLQRKAAGMIRECHGDLHLRNLAWIQGAPVAFDCIEFDPKLRWIDPLSEVAFLAMDLRHRKEDALSRRFLNAYLQDSGDYRGLPGLRFYLIYRALVRAMVASLQASQSTGIEQNKLQSEGLSYLTLAQDNTQSTSPRLILTRGVSASGKSTVTQALLQEMDAIRIRSDVERKRLFGVSEKTELQDNLTKKLYSREATRKTFEQLKIHASSILDAEYSVIVDAVFMNHRHREVFQQLAKEKQVPYIILEFRTTRRTLRKRIQNRKKGVSDADLSVLESQLRHWEKLRKYEINYRLIVDTEKTVDAVDLAKRISKMVN